MKYVTLLFASILCFTASHSQVIVTVAGTGMGGSSGDGGPATNATMENPSSVAFDKDGNLYFSDDAIYKIRKVSPSGIITTVAGNGTSGYGGDGFPATLAQIKGGGGLAVDKWNNIYLADASNQRIRKITTDGIIRTIAGTGVAGYNGDGIPATDAQLSEASCLAVDDSGNIYICDRGNYRLRKINSTGLISTIAGTGVNGFTSDGARADTAAISSSSCVRVDGVGNVYFTDNIRVRKIASSTGLITTLAGNGTLGYSGDDGPATAAAIGTAQFTMDSVGSFYLGEQASNRIRKVNTEGNITTVVGTGSAGLENDGAPVLLARLYSPCGVAFSPAGELNYAEKGNAKIKKVTLNWTAINDTQSSNEDFQLFPNPARGNVVILIRGMAGEVPVTIVDAKGALVCQQKVNVNKQTPIDLINCPPGIYTIRAAFPERIIIEELLIK